MRAWIVFGLIALTLGFAVPGVALVGGTSAYAEDHGGGGDNDARREELRERFESRYREIQRLKAEGLIGETVEGYVEAVGDAEDDARELIADENADRRELYALIADDEKTTPEKVAERNAARNFQKAKSGEYLKGRDGKWKRKP